MAFLLLARLYHDSEGEAEAQRGDQGPALHWRSLQRLGSDSRPWEPEIALLWPLVLPIWEHMLLFLEAQTNQRAYACVSSAC